LPIVGDFDVVEKRLLSPAIFWNLQ